MNIPRVLKLNQVYGPMLTLLAVAAAYAGWKAYWTESEIWSTVVVRYLFSGQPYYDFSVKPLFNLLLSGNYQIAQFFGTHPMDIARALFALNGLVSLYLLSKVARGLRATPGERLLTVLLCVTNSFFIKRYFEVRSDMLVTTVFLALTWLFVENAPDTRGRRLAWYVLASITCAALTPKSLLVSACWGVGFIFPDWRRSRRALVTGLVLAGAVTFVYFRDSGGLAFFIRSFGPEDIGIPYWSVGRWQHAWRFVAENPLIVVVLCMNLMSWRGATGTARSTLTFANLLTLVALPYPEKLPFFLAAYVPFWLMPLPTWWREIVAMGRRITPMVAAFSVFCACYWIAFLAVSHNHNLQKKYIGWLLQRETELRRLTIFDPAGVLAFLPAHNWFVGPSEKGNIAVRDSLIGLQPDVVIGSGKMTMLGRGFLRFLTYEYTTTGDGIFVRRYHMVLPEGQTDVSAVSIRDFALARMPFLKNHPDHKFRLEVLAPGSTLDLSRYAEWRRRGVDQRLTFVKDVSLNDLREGDVLAMTPTAQLFVQPIHIATPYNQSWIELFRFDPHY